MTDPFRHHPELRDLIKDPATSGFRSLTTEKALAMIEAQGLEPPAFFSHTERNAFRSETLQEFRATYGPDAPIWIFGYGSLMTDPGVFFTEVRRADVTGYGRRFILKDIYGGRGTPYQPGIMVALDAAPEAVCTGLIYRLPDDLIEQETEILWQREMIGPAYHCEVVTAETALGPIPTLAFTANHESEAISADLPRAKQIAYCATGTGFFGSSLDYAESIAGQLQILGITDPDLTAFVAEARAYAAD